MASACHSREQGLTLIELLLVLFLTSIIALAATMSIHQIIRGADTSSDMNTAINQVRNAVHWISRDAQSASTIDTTGVGDTFLVLQWQSWDGTNHTATYSLVDSSGGLKELERDRDGDRMTVARYIDPDATSASWDAGESLLTVNVTATVEEQTKSRTVEIKPRPD